MAGSQGSLLRRGFSSEEAKYLMVSGFDEHDSALTVRLVLDEDHQLYSDILPVKSRFGESTGKFILKIREGIPWKVLVDQYVSRRNAEIDPHKGLPSDKELLEQIGDSQEACEQYFQDILDHFDRLTNVKRETKRSRVRKHRAKMPIIVSARLLNFSLFSKGVRQEIDPEDLYYKCYVSNLPLDLTANEFRSFVSQFPKFKSVFIPNKLETTAKGTSSRK